MTPARLIGMALAAAGALVLLAILVVLAQFQTLFTVGYTSRFVSIAGLVGIVGFGLLVSGLRIMSNSEKN